MVRLVPRAWWRPHHYRIVRTVRRGKRRVAWRLMFGKVDVRTVIGMTPMSQLHGNFTMRESEMHVTGDQARMRNCVVVGR